MSKSVDELADEYIERYNPDSRIDAFKAGYALRDGEIKVYLESFKRLAAQVTMLEDALDHYKSIESPYTSYTKADEALIKLSEMRNGITPTIKAER